MIVRMSKQSNGGDPEDVTPFLVRLAEAEGEGRVLDRRVANNLLGRGRTRRTPQRRSLAQIDGDWGEN